ncbi:hypothetical protein K469DRAFT_722063, partial [Zopfia rhizophila CBS 207.26]
MRKQRKEDLERHVTEVNTLLKKANGEVSEGGEMTENGDEEDEWEGFKEPGPEDINRKEEYINEDKYTTVTIEKVGISKEGFSKAGEDSTEESDDDKENNTEAVHGSKKRVWTKEKPRSGQPKKKKKKFRYETKAERKVTRLKQSAKNRAQANARKGK